MNRDEERKALASELLLAWGRHCLWDNGFLKLAEVALWWRDGHPPVTILSMVDPLARAVIEAAELEVEGCWKGSDEWAVHPATRMLIRAVEARRQALKPSDEQRLEDYARSHPGDRVAAGVLSLAAEVRAIKPRYVPVEFGVEDRTLHRVLMPSEVCDLLNRS